MELVGGESQIPKDRVEMRKIVAAARTDHLGRSISRKSGTSSARDILSSDISHLIRHDQINWLRKYRMSERPLKPILRSSSVPPRLHTPTSTDSNEHHHGRCSIPSCTQCRPNLRTTMSRKAISTAITSSAAKRKNPSAFLRFAASMNDVGSTAVLNPHSLEYKIKAGLRPRNLSPGSKALETHDWLCRILFS